MKTNYSIIQLFNYSVIAVALLLSSCEGPMGPPGRDGIDGEIGTIIEIIGDFIPKDNYTIYYKFPNNFKVYDGDAVLVYILWEMDNSMKVWRFLPQTVILNDGILQYNYDFTTADVQIFLEGTTDFNNLRPAEQYNQVFRITVLPAAFLKNRDIDFKDFDAVMELIQK